MNANGPVQDPDLRALLNAHRDEIFASLNAVRVGTIVSFDESKQTATVRINAQAVVFNQAQPTDEGLQQTPSVIDYPVLTDVPVFFPTGGGASLRLPVAADDTCAVLFNDRDLDAWFATGAIVAPNSPRMHSLSDGLAIVGFRSLANKVPDYVAGQAELKFAGSSVIIKDDGTITLVDATGSKVRLSPDKSVLVLSSAGGRASLNADGSVTINGGALGTYEVAADGTVTITGRAGGTVTIKTTGEIEALSSANARLALKVDGTAVLSHGSDKLVVNADGSVEMFNTAGARVRIDDLVSISSSTGSLLTALNAVVTAMTALNAKTGPSAAAQIALAATAITDVLE